MTAMNKVKWDPSGLYIAAGDDEGHVRVCAVAEELALPSAEDATRLAHVFAGLKATATANAASTATAAGGASNHFS